MLGHLDPEFIALLDETNERLRQVFRTANELTFPVSGTGSAGMEAAFVNVGRAGRRGGRRRQRRVRRAHVRRRRRAAAPRSSASTPIGASRSTRKRCSTRTRRPRSSRSCTPRRRPASATTSRASARDKGDALLLVDCVTSLGGIPVEIDGWGVDLAYSGTQKCLGVPPGLAPFTRERRARSSASSPRPQSWYLDLNMIASTSSGDGARAYHHTAPISMIFALHAALGAVLDEGLEQSWARHAACGEALQAGSRGAGLRAVRGRWAPPARAHHRVGALDACPAASTRRRRVAALLDRYGIEVGGGSRPVRRQGVAHRVHGPHRPHPAT